MASKGQAIFFSLAVLHGLEFSFQYDISITILLYLDIDTIFNDVMTEYHKTSFQQRWIKIINDVKFMYILFS